MSSSFNSYLKAHVVPGQISKGAKIVCAVMFLA